MLPRILGAPIALSFGLAALVLPTAPRSQTIDTTQAYHISPDSAAANTAFTMTLTGSFNYCSTFSRESVTVAGNRIDLSFEENSLLVAQGTASPQIVCPMPVAQAVSPLPPIYYPPGPTFQIPGLKAGVYQVYASRVYACMFTKPACMIAVQSLFAGTLTVTGNGQITYAINPTEVAANVDFDLQLTSPQFNCSNYFDNLSSVVSGGDIDLTFMAHSKPGVGMCVLNPPPMGPTFKMAGLKPGTYSVYAVRMPVCDSGKLCPFALIRTFAGTLTVTGNRVGWFLKTKEELAGQPFTMQLLNYAYGSCGTTFTNPSVNVTNGSIYAYFGIQNNPGRVCIANFTPWGPTFAMPALKAGNYPVYAAVQSTCPPGALCPIALPVLLPVDTLVVSRTLALGGGMGASEAQFQAAFDGARVNLTLPSGGSGNWNAEVLTLSGQRLAAARFTAEGGSAVVVDLKAKPQRGIYLVRVESPAHVTRTLTLLRQD